jgi:hypothetical protein
MHHKIAFECNHKRAIEPLRQFAFGFFFGGYIDCVPPCHLGDGPPLSSPPRCGIRPRSSVVPTRGLIRGARIVLIFQRGSSFRNTADMGQNTAAAAQSIDQPWIRTHSNHDSEHKAAMIQSTHQPRLRTHSSRDPEHRSAVDQNTGNG